jgi:hypothetical protein
MTEEMAAAASIGRASVITPMQETEIRDVR